MTHVTHLSYRTSSGGAARSAARIHQTMLDKGVDSAMIAVENESELESVFNLQPSMGVVKRAHRHLIRTYLHWADRIPLRSDSPNQVFTSDRSFRGRELTDQLRSPQIIHMHWVAEMFDERLFLTTASRIAPMVWTMRDMRPITGGCHYDLGCGKFSRGCGNCPQLIAPGPSDLSARIWARRLKTLKKIDQNRLTFVSPSQWLAGQFKHSPLCSRFPIHVIPNGVDTTVFRPRGDGDARVSGVDPEAMVILFNAAALGNQIKGSDLFLKAIKEVAARYDGKKLQLIVVGSGTLDVPPEIPTLSVGRLKSDVELSAVYRSADLFVIPSLQDNCPNTVLEAFASGVPVVGFNVSGIPDLVKPGLTGKLADDGVAHDLAEQILSVLGDDGQRRSMSVHCRQQAVENYSRDAEASRYLELYQQIRER